MEQSLSILQAIFLGAVQGITEFLPISSSGHLVALPAVLGWKEHSLQFDIALHMGTVLALVLYFWKDWASMGLAILGLGPGTPEERRERSRLAWVLMVACVPAAVLGVTIADAAETTLRSPLLVAGMLAGVGVLLLIADRTSRGARTVKDARLLDGVTVGLAQALALVPGVSRSGITMTAGLMRNLSREDAARFSFLLSVPVTLGAGLFGLRDLFLGGLPASDLAPFVAGTVASAVVGYATIAFLLDYVRKHDLRIFVYYRWALAALIVAIHFIRS